MSAALAIETYAVYARLADGARVRVADPGSWDGAQATWLRLDEDRRAGTYPHVQHFEVRSTDDPGYADSPFFAVLPAVSRRGFKDAADAARVAWRLLHGDETPHGMTQGTGGWFYTRNGQTAAQGAGSLAETARRQRIIVQGSDRRWYPLDRGSAA